MNLRFTLTEAERRVLKILAGYSAPVFPGTVGEDMWGKASRQPQHYARPAGKLLRRLEEKGYVWHVPITGTRFFGWALTIKGEEAAKR